jgi:hypothetical protein
MPTKLDKLLQDIDPSKTIDEGEKRMAKGVASYHRDKNTVDTWEECEECIADMAYHLSNAYFNQPKSYKSRPDFGLASNLLREEYGSHRTINRIMMSGAEGGIYTILKTLARLIVNFYTRKNINCMVLDYFNNSTPDEHFAAAKEYYKLYKHLLPEGEDSFETIYAYFHNILREHPFWIKKMRNL